MFMRTFTIRRLRSALLGLSLLAGVVPVSGQSWTQVPSPNPSPARNLLRSISGSGPNDIWSVGHRQVAGSYDIKNLILHYDGSSWNVVPDASPNSIFCDLWGVAAFSPTDAWAVGDYTQPASATWAQILHWDGTAWTQQQVAAVATGGALWGIGASGPADIWAVGWGYVNGPGPSRPYAIHYDGTTWTNTLVPTVGLARNRFDAVDALTPNDVWAVGAFGDINGDFRHLIMHYDGTTWTQSPLPANLANIGGELFDVEAIAPNDVWAVGDLVTGGILLLHYDGTGWQRVTSQGGGGAFAALGPNNIWAVGNEISHWDGTAWTMVDSLQQLSYPALGSTTVLPNGEVWAAGRTVDTLNNFYSLVYKWNGITPQVAITASTLQLPAGGSAQLTAAPSQPGTYQFSWSPATGLSNPAIANPIATPATTTTYTVTMTDPSGAVAQATVLLRVGGVTGVVPTVAAQPIQVWPNPFTNAVTCAIRSEREEAATLTLTDGLGRVAARQEAWLRKGDNQVLLQLTAGAGLYLLTIQRAGEQRRLRLIRQ